LRLVNGRRWDSRLVTCNHCDSGDCDRYFHDGIPWGSVGAWDNEHRFSLG
jgi:hypothetical protein